MTIENCINCAFGIREYQHHSAYRRCHRHAPIVFEGVVGTKETPTGSAGSLIWVQDIKGPVTAWPTVQDTDFCGDFELKDAT